MILENNLYGIDIDTRAAQLASFALLMKAREDDRRLFSNPPKLNIIALQDSQPERLDAFSQDLVSTGIAQTDLKELLDLFEHASTFGSLIQIPAAFAKKLPELESKLNIAAASGDIFAQQSAQELLPLVQQAKLLAKQYDAVIANPPYMGGKGMNIALKDFAKKKYPDSKSDLFAMFIERGFAWCKDSGFNSMVTMQSWMFLSSYEAMREKLLQNRSIFALIQIGYNSFPEINSKVAQACCFTILKTKIKSFKGTYVNLNNAPQAADKDKVFLRRTSQIIFDRVQEDFKKIPGSPVAYWVSEKVREIFVNNPPMSEVANAAVGLQTGDNNRFLRFWQEVDIQKVGFGIESLEQAKLSEKKWFPYNKGGDFRKWYGNQEYLINWEKDGLEVRENVDEKGKQRSRPQNTSYYFLESITWSKITSGMPSFRWQPSGALFDVAGTSVFLNNKEDEFKLLSQLNSKVTVKQLEILSPTLNYETSHIASLPETLNIINDRAVSNAKKAINLSKLDWDSYETSWDFTQNPIIRTQQPNLEQAFNTWLQQNADAVAEMKRLEEENNKLFIDAYGLQDELTPDVPDEQITLTRADRQKDSQRLVSYALGCMMGRYSLDEPGLIYAHAGNQDFDASRYQRFPADADGIIPLTEMHWFEDDATHRIREFLTAVWGKDTLDANMQWLAESLDKKASETAEDTIRRYLASKFYKDHMQTYKKRPIYWLFSSGKQGAFQALVYLHRYNESTLARMRTEYVMPLISKMAAMVNSLQSEIENSDSAAEIKRKEKELQNLHKQQAELSSFEEKLRHYADQRISQDLDDGVKVNYGKFGDLLVEVKAITGEK